MNKLRLVVFVIGLSISNMAYAHWYPYSWCDHAETVANVVSQRIDQISSACVLTPPKLARGVWQSQTVDAWSGGYGRDVIMTTHYRLDHYDRCSGQWLWDEFKRHTSQETIEFSLDNPNLSPKIKESYVANAPMTDQEVQVALSYSLQKCNNIHLGAWPQ